MAFKEGDRVICIDNENIIIDENLIYGAYYIVDMVYETMKRIVVFQDGGDAHSNIIGAIFSSSRFIHENDWIKRMKYGV